jgi:hypothetical protein
MTSKPIVDTLRWLSATTNGLPRPASPWSGSVCGTSKQCQLSSSIQITFDCTKSRVHDLNKMCVRVATVGGCAKADPLLPNVARQRDSRTVSRRSMRA